MNLGISILVALLVFYLLLIELIPPTSLVIPLLGKYLLFTLILVNLSIIFTIIILNLHHRKPTTHKMPEWMKKVFLNVLPKVLFIKRPDNPKRPTPMELKNSTLVLSQANGSSYHQINNSDFQDFTNQRPQKRNISHKVPDRISDAFDGIRFVNEKMLREVRFRDVNCFCRKLLLKWISL